VSLWGIFVLFFYGAIAAASVAYGTTLVHLGLGLSWFVAYLVAINIVAFLFYGFDKLFASFLNAFKMRVPEFLLIWGLAFPGGFVGAWFGMQLFGHKTGPETFGFRVDLLKAFALAAAVAAVVLLIDNRGLLSFEMLDSFVESMATFTLRVTQEVLAMIGRVLETIVSVLRGG
jgi:uncharacterized membrane protein YsdA (DUF1294 family)